MTVLEIPAFRALLLVAMIAGLPLQSVAESRESTLDTGEAPHLNDTFMKGMVVSCPRAGQIWGSSAMTEALGQIGELGVDWIAIHPYARVHRDGTVGSRPADGVDYLERAVEIIRAAGMQIFWKPHLAYWGSFEWRGEIEFGTDEAAWRRFFDSYRVFIVDQARFAQRHGAEIFAIGVEYEKTTHRDEEWRRIIAAVREVYDGRLTYAANWDSLDQVPFWDALDWIGVHAYYPLSPEENPSREALWRGWDEPLRQLSSLSSMHRDKPIFFAEIGYSRSRTAARQPWLPGLEDDPGALQLRRSLIEVALERLEEHSFVRGVFWWKWIPGPDPWDRDFSMKDPEARRALASYWGQGPERAPAKGRRVAVGSEE
jgi:hypothetical protein